MSRLALVLLAVPFFATPAFAADEDEVDADSGRAVKYKSRTEIDFEDVEVSGELVKPEGSLLLDRKRASFNPLIKLRTEFNDEMKASVDEVE
jgi:hypothetical protein